MVRLIVLVALLTGCATQPNVQVYMPTWSRSWVKVEIVEYDTPEELQAKCMSMLGRAEQFYECTEWDGPFCKIHVLRLTENNWHVESYYRGHALIHCTHGQWHD